LQKPSRTNRTVIKPGYLNVFLVLTLGFVYYIISLSLSFSKALKKGRRLWARTLVGYQEKGGSIFFLPSF